MSQNNIIFIILQCIVYIYRLFNLYTWSNGGGGCRAADVRISGYKAYTATIVDK